MNEERFQFYIEFAIAIHSRVFTFERKSNLYEDQIAYYELNKFREIEIGESDSCVNHTDLSENGYKY